GSSEIGPGRSSSATARTTVVRTAAKRGPRGSTPTTGRARSGGVAGGSGRVRDALTGGLLGRSYGYAARPRVRGDDAGTESRESAGPSQTVRRDTGTSACGSGPLPCAWSTRSTA